MRDAWSRAAMGTSSGAFPPCPGRPSDAFEPRRAVTLAEDWIVYREGKRYGSGSTLKVAQNLVDKPYRNGFVVIGNQHTGGEQWERRAGSWCKTQGARPAKGRAQA